jgi:hypothetical protein
VTPGDHGRLRAMRLLPFAAAARTAGLLFTMGFRSTSWPGISVKGQIRRSASARLGQVQGGSRRMRPPKFLPTGHGGGAHADPSFTRPDLCSIRVANEQEELAETDRGGFSADGYPPASDDPPAPLTSGIDRAIRLSTAVAVLAVAGIAAYVSYWHAYAVVRAHGETGITARLEPATIDGLVYASSMVVLSAARHRVPVPCLARWLLGLGIAATLTANMAQGWSHGLVGAVVAAWPAVSLVGSYELLVWLIRTSGAVERGPSAEHLCNRAACRAAIHCLPVSAVDGDRPGGSGRHASDPTRRPAGQAAALPAIPASQQRDNEVPETSAVNDAAVAAYRLSVQAGNPLSERRLAHMFGRTSRRWARARIAGHPGHGLTAGAGGRGWTSRHARPDPRFTNPARINRRRDRRAVRRNRGTHRGCWS